MLFILCPELGEGGSQGAEPAEREGEDRAAAEEVHLFDSLMVAVLPPGTDSGTDGDNKHATDVPARA